MISETEIIAFLKASGISSVEKVDISAFKKRELKYLFAFKDDYQGRTIELLAGFDHNFPLTLPSYFIKEYDSFQFIPHVEPDGWVCYTRDDNVFIDSDVPDQVIQETYALARNTILEGLSGKNQVDFSNEFESYWRKLTDLDLIYANLKITDQPALIKIGAKEKLRFAISEDEESYKSIARFIDISKKGVTYENAIYIPLRPGYYPRVPRSTEKISFHYFRELIQNGVAERDHKKLRKLCSRGAKATEFVIFSFEQPNGMLTMFGFRFSGCRKHPIEEEVCEGKVIPVALQRVDKEYMVMRGGNGKTFFDKKGLVIGAGSVGGFVCEELVRAGFLKVDLVDDDKLAIDNCYRHILGFENLNEFKVEGIKKRIEKIFPHAEIGATKERIEDALKNKKISLSEYDFIVVATGNVTINHFLNHLFQKLIPKPAFFLWNEPYGIGGHVLVSNLKQAGCYACLYDSSDQHNKASFASPIQSKAFLKSISGCASMYTPFSSLDSRNTALLAVRKIIAVLTGVITTNGLYSWKGDDTLFRMEGYNVSERHKLNEKELNDSAPFFISSNCTECSKNKI